MRFRPRTLRGRLALVFGLVTVLLSALVAGFVLDRYHSDLRAQLNDNLDTRYADVSSTVGQIQKPVTGSDLPIIPRAESFAQVLTTDGRVLAASPKALLDHPVLSTAQLERASQRKVTFDRSVPPRVGQARLLAGPEQIADERVVIVVGVSLDELNRAESQLQLALGIALPVLAILVIGAGWLLVGAALRPVRSMVAEADAFSVQHRGQRLSVQGAEELAELSRRLNAMLARIESAMDHERAFLDDASHELRTPIAIARGELELARPLASEGSEVAAAVDSALEEIERLQQLATDLLVLARARSSTTPGDRLDLAEISERAATVTRRTGATAQGAGGVTITVAGHGQVLGDADAVERAVTNLVQNAARHARSRVTIEIETADGSVIVRVRDDGPGFSAAVIGRAGERFVSEAGGVGLGLAIVGEIATAHGGRLELSDDDVGAVAVLRFPAL